MSQLRWHADNQCVNPNRDVRDPVGLFTAALLSRVDRRVSSDFLCIGCDDYNSHHPRFHDMNEVVPNITVSMTSSKIFSHTWKKSDRKIFPASVSHLKFWTHRNYEHFHLLFSPWRSLPTYSPDAITNYLLLGRTTQQIDDDLKFRLMCDICTIGKPISRHVIKRNAYHNVRRCRLRVTRLTTTKNFFPRRYIRKTLYWEGDHSGHYECVSSSLRLVDDVSYVSVILWKSALWMWFFSVPYLFFVTRFWDSHSDWQGSSLKRLTSEIGTSVGRRRSCVPYSMTCSCLRTSSHSFTNCFCVQSGLSSYAPSGRKIEKRYGIILGHFFFRKMCLGSPMSFLNCSNFRDPSRNDSVISGRSGWLDNCGKVIFFSHYDERYKISIFSSRAEFKRKECADKKSINENQSCGITSSPFAVGSDYKGTITSSEKKNSGESNNEEQQQTNSFKLMYKIWRQNHERTQGIDDTDLIRRWTEFVRNHEKELLLIILRTTNPNARWVILVAFISWRSSLWILWFLQKLISCMTHVEQRFKS